MSFKIHKTATSSRTRERPRIRDRKCGQRSNVEKISQTSSQVLLKDPRNKLSQFPTATKSTDYSPIRSQPLFTPPSQEMLVMDIDSKYINFVQSRPITSQIPRRLPDGPMFELLTCSQSVSQPSTEVMVGSTSSHTSNHPDSSPSQEPSPYKMDP